MMQCPNNAKFYVYCGVTMRIISGSAKGIRLKTPYGMETRPTADRVKESVFNILGAALAEARVLDLFAGTGSLGIEALSRGADSALFIDRSIASVKLVKENLKLAKLSEKGKVIKADSLNMLERLSQDKYQFDLIFCDPPYNKGFVAAVLSRIDASTILASDGIIIVEHSKHEEINSEFNQIKQKRTQKYGETLVSFFTYH